MAVTLKQIADKAGLSRQAVGFILKEQGTFKPETRRRVLKIARELGYRPNAAAKAVQTGRFNAVGLLLSTVSWKSTLPDGFLTGIREALAERDMHLSLNWFDDERLVADGEMPKILREMMADGLLIKYDSSVPARMAEALDTGATPAIWVNSKKKHDCVYPDDFEGAREAAGRLVRSGHTRIAYVDFNPRPADDHYSSTDRRNGYVRAMRGAGLRPRVIEEGRRVPQEERIGVLTSVLNSESRPTAIVAYGGDSALPAVHAATLMGMRVPEDLSVMTFASRPPGGLGLIITSMQIPERDMGSAAVEMLLSKIADPKRRLKPRVLSFGFDAGQTCAPPAR